MEISVIGLGYIGLPTALLFSNQGINVHGVDIEGKKVTNINQGAISVDEPGLKKMLTKVLAEQTFHASTALQAADVYIIAVPTPNNQDTYKSCDASLVKNVLENISSLLKKGDTILIESTIAPRVVQEELVSLIEAQGFVIGQDIFVAYCPERVLPGNIIREITDNPRIIGGCTQACYEKASDIYRLIVKGELLQATAAEAEMIKLVENTYRDLNIAYANELAQICHQLDVDVHQVISLANHHPRVSIHQPGPGVGGHCLAVDPYFIVASAPAQSPLIQLGRQVNQQMPDFIVEQTCRLMVEAPTNKITVFGLAYKGNVDDMRESPAHTIIEQLRQKGFEVEVYDPCIKGFDDPAVAKCVGSSLLLVLTDHHAYQVITNEHTKEMAKAQIFDTKHFVSVVAEGATTYHLGNLPA